MSIATAGSIVGNYAAELTRRNPNRQQQVAYLELRVAELQARRDFHHNPTHENLTIWASAAEKLETENAADGEELAAAIQTRRYRKCLAQDAHTTGGCARCGVNR